ncbi:FAD binding domain-containing protein [Longimicrobium terrae]|uniref:Carbon-monoxide dehydrogenase medium subunit n=1 Tax=Longimicrobium terrae TaxID=1639882 RepID=A0A841GYD3_9BACT|nr:xanthine dehydrogenase family protein subunit M [Longimicrobium terrae]MBB4636366.1 carbon-monoxide dehydrogenase medium subunit [Longimicrobium terrae]MBB6070762.1 carbon-monoxide dehydrogenase medium subunit [Longimicrobium terrae]NNC29742.1 xanthine dehydrogenase family protein subunit M [Longimicrobium terrae]
MKPAPFAYHRPDSVDEAIALLAEHGYDAKLLAGGQSLVPAMNFRLAQPAVLIDLNRIPGLDAITESDGGVRIGTMVRQRVAERSTVIAARAPLITETLPWVAHAQIRNRGTVGGSIAHADPAAELPAVIVALGARLHLRGPGGARTVEAADFYTGLFGTALEPEEMLVEIEIPAAEPGTGFAFDEVSRRHGDFALAGVAARVRVDADGRCLSARIALLSVGEGPVLAANAEAALIGQVLTEDAIRAAASTASQTDVDPPGDIHATPAYRRQLVDVLIRRALPRAAEKARLAL